MSEAADIAKSLKIKTGMVQRLNKELTLYKKEAEEQTRKLEARKAEGADGADIRHEERIMQEADKMIPDAQGRLSKTVAALREIVVEARKMPELTESKELAAAEEALEVSEM